MSNLIPESYNLRTVIIINNDSSRHRLTRLTQGKYNIHLYILITQLNLSNFTTQPREFVLSNPCYVISFAHLPGKHRLVLTFAQDDISKYTCIGQVQTCPASTLSLVMNKAVHCYTLFAIQLPRERHFLNKIKRIIINSIIIIIGSHDDNY